jgi:hypothetical protein
MELLIEIRRRDLRNNFNFTSPPVHRATFTAIPDFRSHKTATDNAPAEVVMLALLARHVARLRCPTISYPDSGIRFGDANGTAHGSSNRWLAPGAVFWLRFWRLTASPGSEHCFPVVVTWLAVNQQRFGLADRVHLRAEDIELETFTAERIRCRPVTGADQVQVGHQQVPFAT